MKKTTSFILSLLFLLSVAGCTNASLETALSSVLPEDAGIELPSALTTKEETFSFEPGEGVLVWWSADNTPEERPLTAEEAESGTVTLSAPKGSVMPVLIYRMTARQLADPATTQQPLPRPSGCIWPLSTDIDAAGGFPSRMLWRLLTEADPVTGSPADIRNYCARFNWKRFSEEAAKLDDPWLCDQRKLLRAIASGTFTLRDLKQTATRN